MEYMNVPSQEPRPANGIINYPVSETGEQASQYSTPESGGRAPTQDRPTSNSGVGEAASTVRLSRRELNDIKRQERRERISKAESSSVDSNDEERFKDAIDDWFANKRPNQFPVVLFKLLQKLDEERNKWLQENIHTIPEVIVEAWVSPKPNEFPLYRNISGIGLWKWLSRAIQVEGDKFTLISLSGLTDEILKALVIHYEINVQCLYWMIYIDSFSAVIQPASETVFALCFDFIRLVPLGNERRSHTQAFRELDNQRRNYILTWKWDPFGSEPEKGDRAFDIARAVVWIRRDLETGKKVAIFYVEPKKSKRIEYKCEAQWRMSQFCEDPYPRTRSTQYIPGLVDEEPSEEIFRFLGRYFKEAFRWNRVLALHQQKITALEKEAFSMPMVETTRDLYRQKAALDIHLALMHLQKTMISALRNRQVSETMFWPKNAMLLYGDIEDGLGEKIIEFERMRKQCDDIHNLIFNIISIEESRAAVEQGRSVGRLTWLTFIFLPLSFGASILGMNVFQLESPGLWLYFALTVPLFLLVTGGILALKAGVLYTQSGQNNDMGFIKWLFSGRPMRSQLNRTDLERGNLSAKINDRLKIPRRGNWGRKKEPEAREPEGNKKED